MCTCDRALELINEKIDQCITHENESVLRAHLSECAECRGTYEAYCLIQQDLLDLQEEPPANFAGQVMFRVLAEQQKKKRKAPFGLIGTIACAAALALVVGITGFPKMMSPKATENAMPMAKNTAMESVADYAVADSTNGYEEPMTASDDAVEISNDADGWAYDAVEESEQFDTDMDVADYRELSSYAIVLIYDSYVALGSYADRLVFEERPEGRACTVSIALAEEIYENCPNAISYEIYQEAYMANDAAIILIQE